MNAGDRPQVRFPCPPLHVSRIPDSERVPDLYPVSADLRIAEFDRTDGELDGDGVGECVTTGVVETFGVAVGEATVVGVGVGVWVGIALGVADGEGVEE